MTDKLPKVVIGTPHNRDICPEFVYSLVNLIAKCNNQFKGSIYMAEGTIIEEARNRIWRDIFKGDADYLLFIDSDMLFPPDAVVQLMNLKKDIVGGLVYKRKAPFLPSVYENMEPAFHSMHKFPEDKIFKCDGIGMAFTLISRHAKEVLDKIHPKPFNPIAYTKPANPNEKGEFLPEVMGEDLSFCRRARNAGLEIWCDPTVKLGHVATMIVDFHQYQGQKAYNEYAEKFLKDKAKKKEV